MFKKTCEGIKTIPLVEDKPLKSTTSKLPGSPDDVVETRTPKVLSMREAAKSKNTK